MSGPKTIAYDVSPAVSLVDVAAGLVHGAAFLIGAAADAAREAERLRQEAIRRREELERLSQASDAAEEARVRLVELNRLLRTGPGEIALPAPPADVSAAAMARHADHLRALIEQGRQRLESAQAGQAVSAAMRQAAQALARPPRSVADLVAAVPAADPADTRAERIQGILGRLEGGTAPPPVARLADDIAAARLADPSIESLLAELAKRVADHNRDLARRKAERADAEAMLLQLGDAAPDLAAELARVVAGVRSLDDSLRRRHAEALAGLEQAAKDQYASAVLRRSLAEMGYEVGEEFATLFDDRQEVFAQRPGWGDYHVAMRALPGDSMVNFRLVRAGSAEPLTAEQQRRDIEMEERWCDDYPELLARLEKAGVTVRRVRGLAPGAVLVGTVPGQAVPRRAEKPSGAVKSQH